MAHIYVESPHLTRIAELVYELLLGRFDLPAPADPKSLLAQHEASLFAELRTILSSARHHRSTDVSRRMLPLCQPAVEAIGYRMAYDAAVAAEVRPCLVDLYVANVIKIDAAWYADHAGLGRAAQLENERIAHDAVLPLLEELVHEMDVIPYVSAPIVSDSAWDAFVGGLRVVDGDAQVNAFDGEERAPGENQSAGHPVRCHL